MTALTMVLAASGLAGGAMAGVVATGGAGASAPATRAVGAAPALPAGTRPSTAALPSSITASIALRPSDPSGLQSLATSVSTPGNVDYHQFLTPAEVQARFGPSDAAIATVRSWLSSQGLSVGATEGDGTVIPVRGTAAVIGAAFGTTLANYRLPAGQTAYANTSAPRLPATIAPDVSAVVGLDDLHVATVDLSDRPRHAGHPAAAPTPAGGTHGSTAGPAPCAAASTAAAALTRTIDTTSGTGATADQIASAFDYTALYAEGDFGQGVTVGIFMGGGDYKDSDLAFFQQCYGLHQTVSRVPVNGGASGVSADASVEVSMDIETVASLAPEANIVVYEAPSLTEANLLGLYARAVQDDQAQVMTASFGGCEILYGDPYAEATLFEAMAAQGQSMFASSGDQGAQGCLPTATTLSPSVATSQMANDPAAQPFVTAVGGVHIQDLATPAATVSVWNWGPFTAWVGNAVASGAPSEIWAMPAWQQGFDRSGDGHNTCGATDDAPCREVPDVSGNADARNGEVIYCTVTFCVDTYETWTPTTPDPAPGWFAGGGTSYASPQWAALAALVDEGLPGNRSGLLSPALYGVDENDPAAFDDVVTGNDAYLTQTNIYTVAPPTCTYGTATTVPCYQATPGYDMATGLGIPVAGILVPALQALAVPPLSLTTTSLPGATVGQPYSATLAATGGTAP